MVCIFSMFGFAQLPTDVNLRISDGGSEKIQVAVLPLVRVGEGATPEEIVFGSRISDVVRDDLDFSPFFSVFDSSFSHDSYAEDEEIDPTKWITMGAQAIVYGSYKISDGKVKIDAKLYSTANRKRIYRRKLEENVDQIRRLGHAIADDVCKSLTGEEGVAQTQICYISNRTGNKELFIADYDGFFERNITDMNTITFTPDWSPDGNGFSFTGYRKNDAVLYYYDLSKSRADILSEFGGLNVSAAFSPDGRKVAYCLTKDGNSELYVMDVRSKISERLTNNKAIDTNPTWSPNGLNIAFCSDRSGSPQIYIMDSDGANVRKLSFEGNFNDEPSWSPKGDKIIYTSRTRGQFDIAMIDVTGENLAYLTDKGNNEHPDWSPDGYHIVFCSDRLGSYQIYQMLWDGSKFRRITKATSQNISPSWSPRYKWSF
jgi:TolB protein